MSALATVGDETVSAAMEHRDESMARLLLIEDDKETADEIRAELSIAALKSTGPRMASKGWNKARSGGAAAIIVDRLLPEWTA